MTNLLLDNIMESGLTAKALTMEEVINVNTPSSSADSTNANSSEFLCIRRTRTDSKFIISDEINDVQRSIASKNDYS